jgi:SOS response regulatory protein OraA/RecX
VRFKEKIDAYAHSRDMSVSQLMRKLLKREMEDNGVPPISGWSMHDKS